VSDQIIFVSKRFEDAEELEEILQDLSRATQRKFPPGRARSAIPVFGPEGGQFRTVELHRETLPDGTPVYRIVLKA
jgi:hypothetical protein